VRKLHTRTFELMLDMRDISGISIGRKRRRILCKRALPLLRSELQLAVLHFAEMVEHRGIVVSAASYCLTKIIFRQHILS
jgi:hypothetical protein